MLSSRQFKPGNRLNHSMAISLSYLLSLLFLTSSTAHGQIQPFCSDFDDGTVQGWTGTGVTISILQGGPGGPQDSFINVNDDPGPSSFTAPSTYDGDWTQIGQTSCAELCFDVNYLNDGNFGGTVNMTPSVTINGPSLSATFTANFQISEGGGTNPGWHMLCVPISQLIGGALPPSQDGQWAMGQGNISQWPQLISNITSVSLPMDFNGSTVEDTGYDNICLNDVPCRSPECIYTERPFITVVPGETVSQNPLTGDDPDGGNLTIAAPDLPAYCTLTPPPGFTGPSPLPVQLDCTPGDSDLNTDTSFNISFVDDTGLQVDCPYRIRVNCKNHGTFSVIQGVSMGLPFINNMGQVCTVVENASASEKSFNLCYIRAPRGQIFVANPLELQERSEVDIPIGSTTFCFTPSEAGNFCNGFRLKDDTRTCGALASTAYSLLTIPEPPMLPPDPGPDFTREFELLVESGVPDPVTDLRFFSTLDIGGLPPGWAVEVRDLVLLPLSGDPQSSDAPASKDSVLFDVPPQGATAKLPVVVTGPQPPAGQTASGSFRLDVFFEDAPAPVDTVNVSLTVGEGVGSCTPDETTLCLSNNRFKVTTDWETSLGQVGSGQGVKLTDDTGYFWFFNSDNVEVALKVLDACNLSPFNNFWVFAAGLTDVKTEITVIDTVSGEIRTYGNPQGRALQPIQDLMAFATCSASSQGGDGSSVDPIDLAQASAAQIVSALTGSIGPATGGGLDAPLDGDHIVPRLGLCTPSATTLCLHRGRFSAEATFRTEAGLTGSGQALPITSDTGSFWFFGLDNVEVVVKMLDACGISPFNSFWVFAAGLTDLEVALKITDTATGDVKEYLNPLGDPFRPIQDTRAFLDCP